jgi:hypothetical protein
VSLFLKINMQPIFGARAPINFVGLSCGNVQMNASRICAEMTWVIKIQYAQLQCA